MDLFVTGAATMPATSVNPFQKVAKEEQRQQLHQTTATKLISEMSVVNNINK